MNQTEKEKLQLMIRTSTHIPYGKSNTPILRYPDGSIKPYDVLKNELQDPRFQELEKLKRENPNYNYFYVDNLDTLSKFKLLGKYDGIGISYPNTKDEKYNLIFETPSEKIGDVVDIGGPLLLGTGEIFCIDKTNTSGGKRRKSKRRKSKRRKSKRRYRK